MLTQWLESGITQKQSALADLAIKCSCQWGLREALARTLYVAFPGGLSVWTSCGFLTAWWLASKKAKWRFIFMTSLWKPRSTPLATLSGSKESQRGGTIDNLLAPTPGRKVRGIAPWAMSWSSLGNTVCHIHVMWHLGPGSLSLLPGSPSPVTGSPFSSDPSLGPN